jgi:hypothetical protein
LKTRRAAPERCIHLRVQFSSLESRRLL